MKNFYQIASRPITYHVDEKNRVVVAIMHNTADILTDYLFDTDLGQKHGGVGLAAFTALNGYLVMNPSYSARVFCHPDDAFDPKVGMRLAEKKLMRNVYKGFYKRLNRYSNHLVKHNEHILNEMCRLNSIVK